MQINSINRQNNRPAFTGGVELPRPVIKALGNQAAPLTDALGRINTNGVDTYFSLQKIDKRRVLQMVVSPELDKSLSELERKAQLKNRPSAEPRRINVDNDRTYTNELIANTHASARDEALRLAEKSPYYKSKRAEQELAAALNRINQQG